MFYRGNCQRDLAKGHNPLPFPAPGEDVVERPFFFFFFQFPLRIDNSGCRLHKQSGDNSGSPQGILPSTIQKKVRICLYQLVYDTWQNYFFYKNGEFKIDFFTYIILTRISHLILDLHLPTLQYGQKTFLSRELCLRFLIYVFVLIL